MFNAVIDFGSYAEAAERMHVSQSSISHALAKLQEQLGLPLLILRGRKAQLTEEGTLLLERSRDLMHRAADIEALADSLRHGCGQEIRIALAADYPVESLRGALESVATGRARCRLSVREATPEQLRRVLDEDTVEFAIGTEPVPGFLSRELPGIEYLAVAGPHHPMLRLDHPLELDELEEQCQVVLAGKASTAWPEFSGGRPAQQPGCWQVDSLEQAIAALRHGLAYAWLPRHRLQGCLDAQQLRQLPLGSAASRTVPVYLIHGRRAAAGSFAMRFADTLCACRTPIRPYVPQRTPARAAGGRID
ncbi:conserved hypothetical protein [Massilia sp. 9I]|nr:conserved hypothetical protein [Massilia sp. 9I]